MKKWLNSTAPSMLGGNHLLARILIMAGALLTLGSAHAETTSLQFDPNGNVIQRSTPQGTTTYGYDALNRLQNESGPAKTQTFSYDADSNRLSDGNGSYTYSPTANQLTTRLGVSVSYDPAGNLTADGTGRTFTYNQAGQLYQTFKGGLLQATYYYNHQGQRVRKLTSASAPQGAQTVLYQYDLQGHLMAELTGTGTPIRTYVWRDDTPVAQIEHQPSRKILYFETDHLNTPRAAMDETGKVVWRWESDAFGSTLANEDPDGDGVKVMVNLRLPGQYFDRETGLHYNYFRDYDPGTGRYVEGDPIGLKGGFNLYGYVRGNPLSYIDPYGLRDVDVYVWRAEGSSVGHVMVTEANSTQVILSQFPANGLAIGPNETKSFANTLAAEKRAASEIWRINVPNDKAFDAAAARERNLKRWTASPSNDSTQCSIAASRALRAGGVGLNTTTTGTLMPGFFANGLQSTPGVGVRLP